MEGHGNGGAKAQQGIAVDAFGLSQCVFALASWPSAQLNAVVGPPPTMKATAEQDKCVSTDRDLDVYL
jgi:hypothetical protein